MPAQLTLATLVLLGAVSQQIPVPATTPPLSFARVYATDTPGLIRPTLVHSVSLKLTAEAVDAKVQGNMLLEITVGTDGRVRDALVLKSLDATYGTDERAVATVAQWVFEPATLEGRPVAVRTTTTISSSWR